MANLSARKVDYHQFAALNVQVLGISASTRFSQLSFAASLKLPYPLLSDFPHMKVIRSYGVIQRVGETGRILSRQGFFLIDKQGIVRWRSVVDARTDGKLSEDEIFPNELILKAVRALAGKS